MTESIPTTILTGGAGQAAGSVVAPAIEAVKGIYRWVKRKYGYNKNCNPNFGKLEEEEGYLTSRRNDVKDLIDKNQVIAERSSECTTWLQDVERMTKELHAMRIVYQKIRDKSQWTHVFKRIRLSKKAVKMKSCVVELKSRMKSDHMVLRERCLRVQKFPENISEIPSLRNNVDMLIELLNDDEIKKIGIWGMSGVGKTAILENLNEDVPKLQMFDSVLWVTVSKEDGLHGIQQAILKQLITKVDVSNERIKADVSISKMLEEKKYLLLLDEVSSKIDLREVGIHVRRMKGKVVLATRERTLCYAMETDYDIKIDRMSRADAHKLFCDVVGKVASHPNIVTVADKIVSHCGGLPQIIKAVGIYLKGECDEDLWHSTLLRLQFPTSDPLEHFEDVCTTFKLIYEGLRSSTLRECLLYGAAFPVNHEINRDYLIECWKTEQLIGIERTLREARSRGYGVLKDLIEKCLFDPCRQSKRHVKMPSLFRTAALRMPAMKFKQLIMNKEDVDEHPSMESWRNARVISLTNSTLTELPPTPECPVISTLFLQKNKNISVIPASFFEGMSTLKTLDLYSTCIKELPSSVSKLTNLRGLYLNECKELMTLPNEVRHLQKLEILDVCQSGIVGFLL